jgi:hypothetical protein
MSPVTAERSAEISDSLNRAANTAGLFPVDKRRLTLEELETAVDERLAMLRDRARQIIHVTGAGDDPILAAKAAGADLAELPLTAADWAAHAEIVAASRDALEALGLLPYKPGTPPAWAKKDPAKSPVAKHNRQGR